MARTNKMWILKKKQQQAKQKSLMKDIVWDVDLEVKKDFTNPKGNSYIWFFRTWKYICDITSSREDPDGYRIVRQANKWEIEFKYIWIDSWWFRKYIRKARRQKLK